MAEFLLKFIELAAPIALLILAVVAAATGLVAAIVGLISLASAGIERLRRRPAPIQNTEEPL